jgi:transposase InsO family protein
MVPEKPWSRLHIDHAINFMGSNWLVLVDAYSKYPCIHATTSTSTAATITLLEEDFAHFGYPHTLVTDNATTFTSEEFQEWCKTKGITHLTGAPYHPATNGAAERLVQTFKNALKKSSKPPRKALLEFLMQYRRTPLPSGYSPSELLNGRQLRALIDTVIPSPAQQVQATHQKQAQHLRYQLVKLKDLISM